MNVISIVEIDESGVTVGVKNSTEERGYEHWQEGEKPQLLHHPGRPI